MPPNLRKASERLSTWVDEVRERLSHVACSDDLTAALLSFTRHTAKIARAVSFTGDDSSEDERQQLSLELLTVLYQICAHLHLRSRDFLTSNGCWAQFAYWENQCTLLSYALDLGLICNCPKQALSRVCYILLRNRHLVWDVLVRTRAISASREALDVYQKLASWCPRACASAELYFKFVVCAVCLARQPGCGWHAVKTTVLSIGPATFDFHEWFTAQPALVALLPASSMPKSGPKLIATLCNNALDLTELLRECRALEVSRGSGCNIRSACDAAAEDDMFTFVADDRMAPQEEAAAAPKVEDSQLRGILDSTLRRIPSAIVSPRATDTEPNSELISEAGSSLSITDSFLRAFLGSPSPERSVPGKKQPQVCGRRLEFVRPPSPRPAKRLRRESTGGKDAGGPKGGKTAGRAVSEDKVPAMEEDAEPAEDADNTSLQRERSSRTKRRADTQMTAASPECASANSTVQKTDPKVQESGERQGATSDSKARPLHQASAEGSAKGAPTSAREPRKRYEGAKSVPTREGGASATTTKQGTRNLYTKETPRLDNFTNGKRQLLNQSSGSENSSEVVSIVRAKGGALPRRSDSSTADRRSASKNGAQPVVVSSSEAESGTEAEEAASSQCRKSRIFRNLSSTASDDSSSSEDESEEGAAETASQQRHKLCRPGEQSGSEDVSSENSSNPEEDSSEAEVSEGPQAHHQKPGSRKYIQSKDGSEARSFRGSAGDDTSPQCRKSSRPHKMQGGSDSESEESGPVNQRKSVSTRKPCIISDSSEQESCDEQVIEASGKNLTSHDAEQPEVGSSSGGDDPGGEPSHRLQSPLDLRNTTKSRTSNGTAAAAKPLQRSESDDSSATDDSSESESCSEMVIQKKNGKPSTSEPQKKLAAPSRSDGKSRSEVSQSRQTSASFVEVGRAASPSRTRKVRPNRILDSSEEDLCEDEAAKANNERPASPSQSADEIPCGQRSPRHSQQRSTQASSSVPTTETLQSASSHIKTGREESVRADESGDSSDYKSSDSEVTKEATKPSVLQHKQKVAASSGSRIELRGKASNRCHMSHPSRQQEGKSSPSSVCSRPHGEEDSESSGHESPARKLCRKSPGSSKQEDRNEFAGSSGPKAELTHVPNGQESSHVSVPPDTLLPKGTVTSAVVNRGPARDPKRKSVICGARLGTSSSAASQSDGVGAESEADTVVLSGDDELACSVQRQRGGSLSQASTVMASPERRSPSLQRERTPAVRSKPRAKCERRVSALSGEERQPSEERPVFKLPQLLQAAAPKSLTSGLPSGSDDVGTSAGQPAGTAGAAKKTPSRGASPSVKKVLSNGKRSAASDENDISKSGSNAVVGSDGSAASFSPDESPSKPGRVARRMSATGNATESTSFSEQTTCVGPSAVKRKRLEGTRDFLDHQDVALDMDAKPLANSTSRCSRQGLSENAPELKSELEAASLQKRSSSSLLAVKKNKACEEIPESSQSDSDDEGPGRRSHLLGSLKTEMSPEAGPIAGIANKRGQPQRNSERAHKDAGDGSVPNVYLARSSSRETEERNVGLGLHQSGQASAVKRPAAKPPQGRRTVIERRSVSKSDRESVSEDTAALGTPKRRSCRTLANGKVQTPAGEEAVAANSRDAGHTEQSAHGKIHSSPVSRNENETSSSSDEELHSELGAAMLGARKRQPTGKAADSMPLTKGAGAVASGKSAAKRRVEPAASGMKQRTRKMSEEDLQDNQCKNPLWRRSDGSTSTKCDTPFPQRAREKTVSEREQTTESEDADSEPRRRSTRAKSSRLRQAPIPKAKPSTKVKAGVLAGTGQILSSPDDRSTLTDSITSQSKSREGKGYDKDSRTEWEDERSNTGIHSARLQSSALRLTQTSQEDHLLQAEMNMLDCSECVSSALVPGPSSVDMELASVACSSLAEPSTSRRSLFPVSVGRELGAIPGSEWTTESGRHLTLACAGEEDAFTKLSQASDNLSGLTQKPRSFFAGSEEERGSSSGLRRSLRRHKGPETVEQFVIDYDEHMPSFTDTDDDNDPLFEIRRRVNIDVSSVDFERSVVPFHSPAKKEIRTPQSTPSNDNTKSKKPSPATAGRLSLTAIRAKTSLPPAVMSNATDGVSVTLRRDGGDGCKQQEERPEKSARDTAGNKQASTATGPALAAATSDTPNTPALRRSARISRRVTGRASDATGQGTSPSGRSHSLGLLNEKVESAPANETSQFWQAPHEENLEGAVQKRRSRGGASEFGDSTPGPSLQSLNEDSSDESVTDERVTPVKVIAERIEDAVVRAQSRCFTCSSCSRSFSETTPKTRDSETMTDESSFRQEAESPSKRRKGSEGDASSPSTSVSSRRRSSGASRERSGPTRRRRRETSPRRVSAVSCQSGAATMARSTVLRMRSLRATVTAPRRLSYM